MIENESTKVEDEFNNRRVVVGGVRTMIAADRTGNELLEALRASLPGPFTSPRALRACVYTQVFKFICNYAKLFRIFHFSQNSQVILGRCLLEPVPPFCPLSGPSGSKESISVCVRPSSCVMCRSGHVSSTHNTT